MKFLSVIILIAVFMSNCTTNMPHGSKTNGINYLNRTESYLNSCDDLGTIIGIPSSLWGGKIGNSQARVDALGKARQLGATHFLETDSNWADGNVTGRAYKCNN
jgi:hypothetical protein